MSMVAVKVCGVRDASGARAVREAGADFAGLLFVPGRRRSVTVEQAQRLMPLLGSTEAVGVFRDASFRDILGVAERLRLRTVQLHGAEPPSLAQKLRERNLRVIRALSAPRGLRTELFEPHQKWVDVFLVDGPNPGSGKPIPIEDNPSGLVWSDLAGRPVWLAGGLTPENVRLALAKTGANGADVASGVEREGMQDPARIRDFVRAARGLMT